MRNNRFGQNQPRRLPQDHITNGMIAMIPSDIQNSPDFGKPFEKASDSPKKFIPKKPARKDIGRNITETIVKVFMMSLVRFDTTYR